MANGPTLVPVARSSNIHAIGYDPASKRLAVQFGDAGGRIYHYDGVEPHQHAELLAAPSVGSHFAAHIKGKFPSRQVS